MLDEPPEPIKVRCVACKFYKRVRIPEALIPRGFIEVQWDDKNGVLCPLCRLRRTWLRWARLKFEGETDMALFEPGDPAPKELREWERVELFHGIRRFAPQIKECTDQAILDYALEYLHGTMVLATLPPEERLECLKALDRK